MTKAAFEKFSICLQYASPGNAPAWDAGCARYYYAMLGDVPDADAPGLMVAVGKEFNFRASAQQILELWRQATRASLPGTADEMVGKMLEMRARHGVYHARIPDDLYCRWAPTEPPWTDALWARLSHAMGGWTAFCSDDSPLGVVRGQLHRAASAIIAGEDETAIDRLRLEYAEQRREHVAALPQLELEGLGPALVPHSAESANTTLTRIDLSTTIRRAG